MTSATVERIENEITELRHEVGELRMRILPSSTRDDERDLRDEMELWDHASEADFSAFAVKHKL